MTLYKVQLMKLIVLNGYVRIQPLISQVDCDVVNYHTIQDARSLNDGFWMERCTQCDYGVNDSTTVFALNVAKVTFKKNKN